MAKYENNLEMALVSEIMANGPESYRSKVIDYVANKIRNADKGSRFEVETRQLVESVKDDPTLVEIVLSTNRDGLVGAKNGDPLGLIGYHSHENGDVWKVYRFWVNEGERGQGNCYRMTKEFLRRAREKEVKKIKMSDGGSEDVDKLINKLSNDQDELGIRVDAPNYWIYINYASGTD